MANSEKIGVVELSKLEIVNYNDTKRYDITKIFGELNIYEDLTSPTLYGNVVVFDSLNLIQELPITGEETLLIRFKSPGVEDRVKLNMRVYKISDPERSGVEKGQTYVLHFASPEMITNETLEIRHGFVSKPISRIVKTVFDTYLNSDKLLEIEDTLGRANTIIAKKKPFQALNMLSNMAYTATNPSSNFIFYEDQNGFHFRTIESFLSQDIKKTYFYIPTNLSRRDYDEDIIGNEQFKIISVDSPSLRDILENLGSGFYGGELCEFDPITKKYSVTKYDYRDDFNTTKGVKHLEKYPLTTQDFDAIGTFDKFIISEHSASQNGYVKSNDDKVISRNWQRFLLRQQATFSHMTNVVFDISVPGDSTVKIGDVVRIDMPQPTGLTQVDPIDKYLSGKYLVTRVRHKINQDQYTTILQVVKDSSPKRIV